MRSLSSKMCAWRASRGPDIGNERYPASCEWIVCPFGKLTPVRLAVLWMLFTIVLSAFRK